MTRRRRAALVVCACAAALVAAGVWALTRDPYAAFEDAVREARAAGIPATLAETLPPPVPPEENAIVGLREAWEALRTRDGGTDGWPRKIVETVCDGDPRTWWDVDLGSRSGIAGFLGARRQFLRDAVAASRRPRCVQIIRPRVREDGTVSLGDDPSVELAWVGDMLLDGFANAAPDEDDRRAATTALIDLGGRAEIRTSRDLSMRVQVLHKGLVALRRGVLDRGWDAGEMLRRCRISLARSRRGALAQVARTEVVIRTAECRDHVRLARVARGQDDRSPVVERLVRALLHREPPPDTIEHAAWTAPWVVRSWTCAATSEPEPFDALVERVRDVAGPHPLSLDLMPGGDWQAQAANLAESECASRLALVALAVKARRDRTGAWPASLDAVAADLPNGVPVSPWDGRAFRYVVGDASVRLWDASMAGDAPAPGALTWRDGWEFPR